jgi:aspartate-semialdehyde dehydrogenase
MSGLTVAVLGATGAVGREMWNLLEESRLPITRIHGYTSDRSQGTQFGFRGETVVCREISEATIEPVQLVLASAGASASRTWSPRFVAGGAVVVDNSSAFRGDPECPLVVPEINANVLGKGAAIIANPNCSTIQMVMVLAPLDREWGLSSVKVATYQSASGAGGRAVRELLDSSRAVLEEREDVAEIFPHPLGFNVVPQIGGFDDTGESLEEIKMRNETRRILERPDLPVSATCVRVPVVRGHSEAVWTAFDKEPEPDRARELLREEGIKVEDDTSRSVYPLPRRASGRHEVFVGRVRRDPSDPRGLSLWVVADNLLKGAATNAFQIAEMLVDRGLLTVPSRP